MRRVYGRGLNIVGQIDSSLENYRKFTPIRELEGHSVRDLGCGYTQSYYLLSDGQFLKFGDPMDTLFSVRNLNWFRWLPSVWALAHAMQVLSKYTGLSSNSNEATLMNKREILDGITFTKAVFGISSAHLFDDRNNMYVIGENYFGERATGDTINSSIQFRALADVMVKNDEHSHNLEAAKFSNISSPTDMKTTKESEKATNRKKIVDVAIGFQHSVLITGEGEAYGCGKDDVYQISPYCYHYYKDAVSVPSIVTPELIWDRKKIVKAACGYKHSILMAEDGTLYSIGLNKYGQCGVDPLQAPQVPRLKEFFFPLMKGEHIVDLKCGSHHTLILTNLNLYFMGQVENNSNPFIKYNQNVSSPTIMNLPSRPIKIYTNFDRIAVICEDSKAYIFGGKDLKRKGGESNQLEVIDEFKFGIDSIIGLGFAHTIISV